jgi:hypothetical protein
MRLLCQPTVALMLAASVLAFDAAAQTKTTETSESTSKTTTTTTKNGSSSWSFSFSEFISNGNGPRVQGSGNVVEQARQLSGFNRVRLEGAVDAKLRAANGEAVVVRTDDNIAPLIETTVENGVLVIGLKKNAGYRTKHGVTVLVDFKELTGVSIKGSGDLMIDRLQAPQFEAAISGSGDLRVDQMQAGNFVASVAGSGDMTLSGAAQKQVISVAGSGNVQAKKLAGKEVKVSIAGSGDVVVNASASLDVTIAGSGNVSYLGNPPKVSKSVAGSGEVASIR